MPCKQIFSWLLVMFLAIPFGLTFASESKNLVREFRINDASGSSVTNFETHLFPALEFKQLRGQTAINYKSGPNTDNSKAPCEPPFHQVGSHCLLIDNMMLGNWSQMRQVCQVLGGDLVNMKDANILYDISNYIKDNGLGDTSYWVGASDQEAEGQWVWTSDNSAVRMGIPLWGVIYGQEPNGGYDENCGIISKHDFFYMHDDACGFQYNGLICQPAELVSASDSLDIIQPKECPLPFEVIGGTCLHVYFEEMTAQEARYYCASHSSHLAKIDDANLFGVVYDYIIDLDPSETYWIDGSDDVVHGEWRYSDGTFVKYGTPFWYVVSDDIQAPESISGFDFICLIPERSYFFRDCNRDYTTSCICQYDLNN